MAYLVSKLLIFFAELFHLSSHVRHVLPLLYSAFQSALSILEQTSFPLVVLSLVDFKLYLFQDGAYVVVTLFIRVWFRIVMSLGGLSSLIKSLSFICSENIVNLLFKCGGFPWLPLKSAELIENFILAIEELMRIETNMSTLEIIGLFILIIDYLLCSYVLGCT